MHNMLNQFYNYLAIKLNGYFKNTSPGERFYLQFDEADQVGKFYEALENLPETEKFTYKHPQGTPYETFMINHQGAGIVVAATIGGITPDYLVTLRNEVSEQQNEWENKALLIVCSETLDSIKGGSSDLQKEGMPFHVDQLTKNITDEIEESKLKPYEKEILKFHLKQKREDALFKTNLWDYEEVLGFIHSEKISVHAYEKLNLFRDDALETFSGSNMRNRIRENAELFEKVSNVHQFDDVENRLSRILSEKGVNRLKKDRWMEVPYTEVNRYKEELNQEKKQTLVYRESPKKVTEEGISFWERPLGDKGNQSNKRQIIVFNPEGLEELTLKFSFDDFLKKEFIDVESQPFVKTSGKKLEITLAHKKGGTSFYRVIYNHNKNPKTRFQFDVCVIETTPDNLKGIMTKFEIDGRKQIVILKCNYNEIFFGPERSDMNFKAINTSGEEVFLDEDESFRIDEGSEAWESDTLIFTVDFNGAKLPILIKDENNKVVPIDSSRIWKLKREAMDDFTYDAESGKFRQGSKEYSSFIEMRPFLRWEKEWIHRKMISAKLDGEEIKNIKLSLPEEVERSFLAVLDWYEQKDKIPTLTFLDDVIKRRMRDFLDAYNLEIEKIEDKSFLTREQKNLSKIGLMENHQRIYLSPFHPLLMEYQLQIMEELQDEQLDNNILDRLQPNNLLPYLYSDTDDVYKVVVQKMLKEWVKYEPDEKVSVGETNSYLAVIVEEKLKQFLEHFKYLFIEGSKAHLKLNVVNLKNDEEIVKGLILFLKDIIEKKGPDYLFPIEVSLYGLNGMFSEFERLSTYDNPEMINAEYGVDLDHSELDPTDMLRLIRENIIYSKHKFTDEFTYAHITFYKMKVTDKFTDVDQMQMDSGLTLDGLLSSMPSHYAKEDYRSGFGMKNVLNPGFPLPRLSKNLNELMANMKSDGQDTYKKDMSIASITSNYDQELLKKIYDASNWVTFVDPNVGFDFFKKNQDGLIIIHYSDQYSNSSKLDSITVTNKVVQYKKAVSDFLSERNENPKDKGIEEAIQSFNSLNGEWLLRMIGRRDEFAREKLSILSAIKAITSILKHDNFTWIPVSLEEVLRVAGAVKLKKADGLFSAKNLLSSGVHSDDLLMIGVEDRNEDLKLHFYPVEVKVGINPTSVTSKADEQITKTYGLIEKELAFEDEDGEVLFKNKFYRNFFIQILFSNMEKMKSQEYYKDGLQEKINRWKKYLLNDKYSISKSLQEHIGIGALVSFKKDQSFRSLSIKETMHLTLTEEDAYQWVTKDLKSIEEGFQSEKFEIPKANLLSNILDSDDYVGEKEVQVTEEAKNIDERETVHVPEHSEADKDTDNNPISPNLDLDIGINSDSEDENEEDEVARKTHEEKHDLVDRGSSDVERGQLNDQDNDQHNSQDVDVEVVDPPHPKTLEAVRVLIGTAEGSTRKVYWEYGHKQLANRHILISGKSGQGKSYFIQCLLAELTQQGMTSIIFDYTDGFKTSKLEPKFKEVLGDKIEQFLVAMNKFPINPFKKNKKEIDEGLYLDEDAIDVAERIKSVLGSVYKNLGIQQLNAIYESVVEGINTYGDYMHFGHLLNGLDENASASAKTAASTIKPLIDKNPFDHRSEFNWKSIFDSKGKVFIIQLAGFTRDVQLIITELILWDLWNYKVHDGFEANPFSVILDEAQNLDHTEKSPSARVLTEGRKFGWSGWYATQFMKGTLGGDEIMRLQNSGQKIYFSPPDAELPSIASYLSTNPIKRKDWEKTLKELRKGQCISVGPMKEEDGSLNAGDPVVVNIDSLESRKF